MIRYKRLKKLWWNCPTKILKFHCLSEMVLIIYLDLQMFRARLIPQFCIWTRQITKSIWFLTCNHFVKKASIPRLELMGVLIAIRAISFVERHLGDTVIESHLGEDSLCVHLWLKQSSSKPVFVDNRVKEIRNYQEKMTFHYVCWEDNPAGIVTRGCSSEALINNRMWWNGPSWLIQHC